MERKEVPAMDFVGKRKICYIISSVIIIAGLLSVFIQGLNLGIDFAGGNLYQVSFTEQVEISQVREAINDLDIGTNRIQELDDGSYQIKTLFMDQATQEKFVADLDSALGGCTLLRAESVGASVGAELLKNGLIALFVAVLLMIAYITWRYEWRFAISAIAALFHDVLVTLAVFSIFQLEVESYFIAAVLTIFGYSVNNTIVIFDRIRENTVRVKKDQLAEVVNLSNKQSLTRTINTSVSTLILLVALFIFGGQTTRMFVLAMIIGITAGTYSSIMVAPSLWYDLRMKSKGKVVEIR